jgi:hypothetical protein
MAKQKVIIEVEYDLDDVKNGKYDLSSLDVIKDIQIKGVTLNHGVEEAAKFQNDLGRVINEHVLVDVYGKPLVKPLSYPTKLVLSWIAYRLNIGEFNSWRSIRDLKRYQEQMDPDGFSEQEKKAIFLSNDAYEILELRDTHPSRVYCTDIQDIFPSVYLSNLSAPVAKMVIERIIKEVYYWQMFLKDMANFGVGTEGKYVWKTVERVLNDSYHLTTPEIMSFILPEGNHIRKQYINHGSDDVRDFVVSQETLELIGRELYRFNDS